jgi:aryl-alcohol dehydrogenase-like predicted oxidoreductase
MNDQRMAELALRRTNGPPRLTLGTMNFGGRTQEPEARAIIERAFERGIRVLDTANMYEEGESERIIGRAIAGRRDDFVLASKVGLGRVSGRSEGLGASAVSRACEASLARLGTDVLDVYYLHAPDPRTPITETLGAIKGLLDAGKIRAWGISNYASWQILEMFEVCQRIGLARPVMSQVIYNLLVRQIETEYTRFAASYQLHTTVYNPLAGGLLSGRYQPGSSIDKGSRFDGNARYQRRYWSERLLELTSRYAALAPEIGLLALSYAWLAQRPWVDSILVGPATVAHLDAAIDGVACTLPGALMKQIDETHYSHLGTDASYAR